MLNKELIKILLKCDKEAKVIVWGSTDDNGDGWIHVDGTEIEIKN